VDSTVDAATSGRSGSGESTTKKNLMKVVLAAGQRANMKLA
jgi:hypothetical protein